MAVVTQALRIDRIPGEFGPILRCHGKLTGDTAAALRRELDLLVETGHPAVTVNVTGCRELDAGGIAPLLDAYRRLRSEGRRFVLVADTNAADRLYALGIGWHVRVYPTEESAARAHRGGYPPAPPPETWQQARRETVATLRAVHQSLDCMASDEIMRELTAMLPICEKAEEAAGGAGVSVRCRVCPLFFWHGGEAEDIGCRRALDPVLLALRSGDRDTAREQIAELTFCVLEMALPEGGRPPAHDLPLPPA